MLDISTVFGKARKLGAIEGVASPGYIVLCYRCAGNHDSCGVLYLHLTQQDVAILGQLDI